MDRVFVNPCWTYVLHEDLVPKLPTKVCPFCRRTVYYMAIHVDACSKCIVDNEGPQCMSSHDLCDRCDATGLLDGKKVCPKCNGDSVVLKKDV